MHSLYNLKNYISVLKWFETDNDNPSDLDLESLIAKYPTMLVGCKKDMILDNKTDFMQIDTKVKKELKSLGDIGNLIQYVHSGYDT